MSTAENFQQYVLPTYGRFPIVPVKGDGAYLWDDQGNRYLDFCTGVAVCSLGHCHPRLVKAIQKQAATLMHCSNLYQIPQQAELAKKIVELVEIPGKVFFSNSGAESNEGLIKLARRFGAASPAADGTPRHELITFKNSFHGRTMGSLTATGQDALHQHFSPLLPGSQYGIYNDLASVESLIGPHTAAILLEPIQGEGGVHVATAEFLRGLRALCDKHNLLFMLDEVQAGFGRTGQMMAWRSSAPEIQPDAVSWAKGIGGGFPLGAFWVSDRIMPENNQPLFSVLGPKSHGSTYGGNPLACAAGLAVLSEISKAHLLENVRDRETQIRSTIANWNLPVLTNLRGQGLLLGFALDGTKMRVNEGSTPALTLTTVLNKQGLLTVPAGPETLRWLPPLNVSMQQVNDALDMLHAALVSVSV